MIFFFARFSLFSEGIKTFENWLMTVLPEYTGQTYDFVQFHENLGYGKKCFFQKYFLFSSFDIANAYLIPFNSHIR